MNTELWKAQLDNVDEKHEAAHRRLRGDMTDLELRVSQLASAVTQVRQKVDSPVDAGRIAVPMKLVILILGAVLTIIGTVYTSSSSIHVQMQSVADQLSKEQALQQLRNDTLMSTLSDLKRQQQLDDYNIQDLQKTVNMLQKGLR